MGNVNGREDESIPAAADASVVKPVTRAAHALDSRSAILAFSDSMTNSPPHSPHVPNRRSSSVLRFVVDAKERYIPDLPNVADEMGQSCKWTGVLCLPYFLVFLLFDGGRNFLKIWLLIIVSVGAHKVFGINPL
ncbi:hypothetical protein VNO78_25908 [Psophocarpus tetragonolobus]|uniref:Uncharacterized protein n=1 Tax=Psophocarpus tetragonolobus TaxID=3891 RepID=A0AAN9XG79_PSOTE